MYWGTWLFELVHLPIDSGGGERIEPEVYGQAAGGHSMAQTPRGRKKIQVFLCVRIHDTRGFDAERNVLRRKVETHVEQAPEY